MGWPRVIAHLIRDWRELGEIIDARSHAEPPQPTARLTYIAADDPHRLGENLHPDDTANEGW